VRGLFKEWLGLNFEFTYEEANTALDAIYIADDVRVQVESVLEDMNLAEFYQDHEQSEEELQGIVHKIDELLPKLLGSAVKEQDVIAKIFSTLKLPTFRKKTLSLQGSQVNAAFPNSTTPALPPLIATNQNTIAPKELSLPSETLARESELMELRKQVQATIATPPSAFAKKILDSSPSQSPAVQADDSGLVLTVPEPIIPTPDFDDHALMVEDESPAHELIYERLERLYDALSKSKLDDAKSIYNDILSFYHPLPVDEKRKYYDVLYQVYQKLATM
jgi:hypothetical protein